MNDDDADIIAALADVFCDLGIDDIVDPQEVINALREGGFMIRRITPERTAQHGT
jgi:hypothetical protein